MSLKRIRDPLYGFIQIDDQDIQLIDHRLTQRLRWVSQLPLEQLVYPSAQHSRFEHSLGVMHLAGVAAKHLLHNSQEHFQEAANSHTALKSLSLQEQEEIFIRSSRWAGLLHDLGHAPFSHTLEDACKFSTNSPVTYDHEYDGYFLARRIFEDLGNPNHRVADIVLRVLNKEMDVSDLYPVEILIRRIIDGPIDVDKGDYLHRDSYHCGVNYGVYDHSFLWDNVVITDSYQMGVLPKAALEAWSLTLARHKMFNYVYKHHIRNITDALLVEILQLAFDNLDQAHDLRDIIPLQSVADVQRDQYIHKFVHWTDNSLLKAADTLGISEISSRIEAFSSRKLYKRGVTLNLSEYPNAVGNESEVLQVLDKLKWEMSKQGIEWNAIPVPEVVIPVFERRVQQNLLVQKDSGQEVPVAEYLGFGVMEEQILEKGDTYLHVFVRPLFPLSHDELQAKIEGILRRFEA